ncbi:MAG: glucokinase, partial [Spirochaetales bacterium]|nr:glucokinase [Spirochaetales bacterium]MCF7937492.1 glucokinase [Spirochaetales bacterium]
MAEAALKTVLAVDVGGTNTSLDLVDVSTSEYRKISSRKLSSHSIIEFPEAVKSTLQDMLSHSPEARPQAACFSVAGPVQGRSCKPTNLHWFVDADLLETSLGFPCSIINDFSAICYAVPLIDPNDTNLLLTIPHTDGSSGIR